MLRCLNQGGGVSSYRVSLQLQVNYKWNKNNDISEIDAEVSELWQLDGNILLFLVRSCVCVGGGGRHWHSARRCGTRSRRTFGKASFCFQRTVTRGNANLKFFIACLHCRSDIKSQITFSYNRFRFYHLMKPKPSTFNILKSPCSSWEQVL